jgi:hypothetical protein
MHKKIHMLFIVDLILFIIHRSYLYIIYIMITMITIHFIRLGDGVGVESHQIVWEIHEQHGSQHRNW